MLPEGHRSKQNKGAADRKHDFVDATRYPIDSAERFDAAYVEIRKGNSAEKYTCTEPHQCVSQHATFLPRSDAADQHGKAAILDSFDHSQH